MFDMRILATTVFTGDGFLARVVQIGTPYFIWKQHPELKAAREMAADPRTITPCTGSFSSVWGVPSLSKLFKLLQQRVTQVALGEFGSHWFINCKEALPLRELTRLLGFCTIARLRNVNTTHQAGTGSTGNRRVQSHSEDGSERSTQLPTLAPSTPAKSTPSAPSPSSMTTDRPRSRGLPVGSLNRVRGGPSSRGRHTRGGRGRGRGIATEGVEYAAPRTLAKILREEAARVNDDDPQIHARSFGFTECTW